jgi:acetyl-CoA carboxylase carboxyltransferase component
LFHRGTWQNTASVGVHNYLVEGVSGTGKTSVCAELNRRGYQAINGDKVLAYRGDPETGEAIDTAIHEHHIWNLSRLPALVAEPHEPVTFFCGGSRTQRGVRNARRCGPIPAAWL